MRSFTIVLVLFVLVMLGKCDVHHASFSCNSPSPGDDDVPVLKSDSAGSRCFDVPTGDVFTDQPATTADTNAITSDDPRSGGIVYSGSRRICDHHQASYRLHQSGTLLPDRPGNGEDWHGAGTSLIRQDPSRRQVAYDPASATDSAVGPDRSRDNTTLQRRSKRSLVSAPVRYPRG